MPSCRHVFAFVLVLLTVKLKGIKACARKLITRGINEEEPLVSHLSILALKRLRRLNTLIKPELVKQLTKLGARMRL